MLLQCGDTSIVLCTAAPWHRGRWLCGVVVGEKSPRRRQPQDRTGVGPLAAAAAVPRRLTGALGRGCHGKMTKEAAAPVRRREAASDAADGGGPLEAAALEWASPCGGCRRADRRHPRATEPRPAARLRAYRLRGNTQRELLC